MILDRYIAANVLPACALVLGVILGLDLLLALSQELEAMDQGASFSMVLTYIAYTAPYTAYIYMPLVLLVGTLIGLGNLANSNELTVVRAAGMSLKRLSLSALMCLAPLLILTTLMGEYVVPWSQQSAMTVRAEYRGVSAGKGFWLREGDSYVHVGAVAPDNSLRNIRRFSYAEQNWQASLQADAALFQDQQWLLIDGQESRLHDGQVVLTSFTAKQWPITLSTELVSKLSIEPKYLSATDLRAYANFLQSAGINADLFNLAFWKKALQPFFTFSLVLVAMSFVFGSQRAVPIGQRVLFGVLTGLGFNYAQEILGPASSIFGFSPVMAYAVPVVVCVLVAAWLLRRVR